MLFLRAAVTELWLLGRSCRGCPWKGQHSALVLVGIHQVPLSPPAQPCSTSTPPPSLGLSVGLSRVSSLSYSKTSKRTIPSTAPWVLHLDLSIPPL